MLASYEATLRLCEGLLANVSAGDPLQDVMGLAQLRIGRLFSSTGKPTAALASFERGIAIEQKLADAHLDDMQFQTNLGTGYAEMAEILDTIGKPAERLTCFWFGHC